MKIIRIKDAQPGMAPVVDVIPDSALQKSGKPFFVPDFAGRFCSRIAVAVRICRLGKNIARKFASRYYDGVGVCLAIEAADLLEGLRDGGAPWALATAFDGSVIAGDFLPVEAFGSGEMTIVEEIDGSEACRIQVSSEQVDFDGAIERVSRYFTLKIGDYILVDSHAEPEELRIGSHLRISADGMELVNIRIK